MYGARKGVVISENSLNICVEQRLNYRNEF